MLTPPISKPPMVPMSVRRHVAKLAHVPVKRRKEFCDVVQLPLYLVWLLDRRASGTSAQSALIRASEAARALNEAFGKLDSDDRKWVEYLWSMSPQYEICLPVLPQSVEQLAHLFSIAVNKAPPRGTSGPHQRGRRQGDVKDFSFRQFVHHLLVVTEEWCGGDLTFDKNYESGTLIEAIKILGKYLPVGVVPTPLPLHTIDRVKNKPAHYTSFGDINFFRFK